MTPEEFYKEIGADYQTALSRMMGNLELTPLYETCTRLSDATRGGKKDGDVQGLFLAVREAYRNVMENVKKLA